MSADGDPEELLSSDDPADRLEAVHSLYDRPRRHAVPVLLEALSDDDEEVSGAAAGRLGRLGTAETVPALVREYVRPDRFPGTYTYDIPYFTALERLGADGVWEPLVDAMEAATADEPVSRCVLLLEYLRDLRARPALERIVADGQDEGNPEGDDVRAHVVRGAEQALDRLDEVAARTEGVRTLDDIRRALDADEFSERETGEMGLDQWAREADTEALIDALQDPRNVVAGAAAEVLGVRGANESIPGLVREVAKEERNLAAAIAAYQFAEEGDLRHGEHARALVRIDDRAAVEPLLDALDRSEDAWVIWDIAWVLGQLGDPKALDAIEALGSGGSGWRSRAWRSTVQTAVARLRYAAESE